MRHTYDVKEQRAHSDEVMAERHAGFDLSAQDHHAKYERAHFAVVGAGTKAAFENYREGWDRIFGQHTDRGTDG